MVAPLIIVLIIDTLLSEMDFYNFIATGLCSFHPPILKVVDRSQFLGVKKI